jgi:hypothetical protein
MRCSPQSLIESLIAGISVQSEMQIQDAAGCMAASLSATGSLVVHFAALGAGAGLRESRH